MPEIYDMSTVRCDEWYIMSLEFTWGNWHPQLVHIELILKPLIYT